MAIKGIICKVIKDMNTEIIIINILIQGFNLYFFHNKIGSIIKIKIKIKNKLKEKVIIIKFLIVNVNYLILFTV